MLDLEPGAPPAAGQPSATMQTMSFMVAAVDRMQFIVSMRAACCLWRHNTVEHGPRPASNARSERERARDRVDDEQHQQVAPPPPAALARASSISNY